MKETWVLRGRIEPAYPRLSTSETRYRGVARNVSGITTAEVNIARSILDKTPSQRTKDWGRFEVFIGVISPNYKYTVEHTCVYYFVWFGEMAADIFFHCHRACSQVISYPSILLFRVALVLFTHENKTRQDMMRKVPAWQFNVEKRTIIHQLCCPLTMLVWSTNCIAARMGRPRRANSLRWACQQQVFREYSTQLPYKIAPHHRK